MVEDTFGVGRRVERRVLGFECGLCFLFCRPFAEDLSALVCSCWDVLRAEQQQNEAGVVPKGSWGLKTQTHVSFKMKDGKVSQAARHRDKRMICDGLKLWHVFFGFGKEKELQTGIH